jgi:hypothetical protein
MIRSRRIRWAGNIVSIGQMRNAKFCFGSLKGGDHSDGRIILKWNSGVDWIYLALDRDL